MYFVKLKALFPPFPFDFYIRGSKNIYIFLLPYNIYIMIKSIKMLIIYYIFFAYISIITVKILYVILYVKRNDFF